MNRSLLLGGLTALALTIGAGAAVAQQTATDSPAPRAMRADADGDGRFSQAEFVGRRVERLTAADADRDGTVTREEMQAVAQVRMAERADARFDRLDANDDGAISREEFDAPREARADRGQRPMRAHRGYGGRGPGMGMRGDRMERGPIVIADVQARTEQAFARLDADQDGFVTVEERRAGMDEHRRERRSARQMEQASPKAPASE